MESSLGSSTLAKEELVKHLPFKSFNSIYKLGAEIGSGTFGIVFKCERLTDKK